MSATTPAVTPAVPPRVTAGLAIAEWLKLTPRQRAIAIVCKHGTSYVGHRTDPATNTIHHAAARRLVRAGTHEYVTGSDGTFLREIPPPPSDLVRLPARCLDQFDNLTAAIECRERRGRPSPNGYAALYTYAVIFGLDQQLREQGTQSGVLAEIRARLVTATASDTGGGSRS